MGTVFEIVPKRRVELIRFATKLCISKIKLLVRVPFLGMSRWRDSISG
jgi:hypothetical protein